MTRSSSTHKRTPLLWMALAALCLSLFCGLGQASAQDRAKAPNFKLKNLKGKKVALDDFKGKVVVVSFWATWCKPCLQELPFLSGFYKENQEGAKDLVVLAINTDGPETVSDVKRTVKSKKLAMPILLDPAGKAGAKLNPRGSNPYTVFIDRQGRIFQAHEGFAPGDEKKHLETIKKLLAETGG